MGGPRKMYVHSIDAAAAQSPEIRSFYYIYLPQRRIIADFYTLLPEESYDYRMVDGADTPRESLVHILQTHLQYLDGVTSGTLDFAAVAPPSDQSKEGLLREMDRVEERTWDFLSHANFDPDAPVEAPWGTMRAGDAVFLTRDHDILHVGWNLALMDHLVMERFPSLKQHWG